MNWQKRTKEPKTWLLLFKNLSHFIHHAVVWKLFFPSTCCFTSGIIRSVARDGWGSMSETCVSRQACCRTRWSTTTWLWSCSGELMTSSGWVVSQEDACLLLQFETKVLMFFVLLYALSSTDISECNSGQYFCSIHRKNKQKSEMGTH